MGFLPILLRSRTRNVSPPVLPPPLLVCQFREESLEKCPRQILSDRNFGDVLCKFIDCGR